MVIGGWLGTSVYDGRWGVRNIPCDVMMVDW